MSWNIEHLPKNLFSLKQFITLYKPDLVFLSEPQIFQMDLQTQMNYFRGEYCASLNSEDLYDMDLPLTRNKSKGGTLVMWKSNLDPYVTIHKSEGSAFLPVILDIPNALTSIHVALYLPTAGKETEYLAELAQLKVALEELLCKYPGSIVFIRGDANSSKSNFKRNDLFTSFCRDLKLSRVPLNHNSYHHFTGNGGSDSELDVLLYSDKEGVHEHLVKLLCSQEDPLIDSHHDLLISSCSIPYTKSENQDKSKNITAPKLDHKRHKIVWTEEGIKEYNKITSELLPDIRHRWQSSSSRALTSVLLQSTNFLMSSAASVTNRMISLTSTKPSKSEKVPKVIKKSTNALSKLNSELKYLLSNPSSSSDSILTLRSRVKELRRHHRKLVRWTRLQENISRDANLTSNTNELSNAVRKTKTTTTRNITKLVVGEKVYDDEYVPDGFYDSISSLKKLDLASLSVSSSYQSASDTYKNILKICESGTKVPEVSLLMADDILKSIRPSVNDFYSITASHYINSGQAGLEHFANLLNVIIADLNNLSIDELNMVWACILYKGHEKDRNIDRSYRTISTCPFLSKAIDTYISILYSSKWNKFTAETQFQNKCSSHELAALTLSEAIDHSTKTLNRPAFALYLDARSAFDLALREFLINNLYEYGIRDQGILLIDQRLKNRRTVCEWNKQMMGPIEDECGVEQGGVNSSDFYKVYNNEQLTLAQDSELGIPLGPVTVSAIGQADDVVLIANDLHSLQSLLELSLYYCRKYNVSLSNDKSKLQVFSSRSSFHSQL